MQRRPEPCPATAVRPRAEEPAGTSAAPPDAASAMRSRIAKSALGVLPGDLRDRTRRGARSSSSGAPGAVPDRGGREVAAGVSDLAGGREPRRAMTPKNAGRISRRAASPAIHQRKTGSSWKAAARVSDSAGRSRRVAGGSPRRRRRSDRSWTWRHSARAGSDDFARTAIRGDGRIRSGVAVDDRVGDQLERRALPVGQRPSGSAVLASATTSSARRRDSSSAPVAAMRSQTSAAASGPSIARRSSARRSGSRSRARMSGSVTVPSSRSVPRGLPVRSGGPETSRTSSRSWNARPMRRPNARRPCSVPSGPVLGAELARRLEERRRLQLAAMQVALDAHLGVPGVLALEQLALGEGGARPRERPHRRERAGERQLGERAREQQVADRDRHVAAGRSPRPSGARDAGRRRRGRRRARASRCGRARRRRRRARRRARRRPAVPRRGGRAAAAAACRRRRSSRRRGRRGPRRARARARRGGPRRPRAAPGRAARRPRRSRRRPGRGRSRAGYGARRAGR